MDKLCKATAKEKEIMQKIKQSGFDVNDLVEFLYQKIDEDWQQLNEELPNKFINELKKMKIRNTKTGAEYSSQTMMVDCGKYYYYCPTLHKFYKADGWEEVDDETDFADKWHDLRKDPEDLPSHDRDVLCYIKGERCNGYRVDYYIDTMDLGWAHLYDVIAWRELPEFEN